jgi:hypothetical protein
MAAPGLLRGPSSPFPCSKSWPAAARTGRSAGHTTSSAPQLPRPRRNRRRSSHDCVQGDLVGRSRLTHHPLCVSLANR